jgi:hypothetical protein
VTLSLGFNYAYLEVEWFHQAYVFHPLCLSPQQVWEELSVREKQKLARDLELVKLKG